MQNMYTEEQRAWLKEHASMSRFQSRNGRIRCAKLRSAFENRFNDTRSKQAIAYQVRHLRKGPFPSELKRIAAESDGVTLSQIEGRLTNALLQVRELKSFIQV